MRKQVRYENNVAVMCIFIEKNISGDYLVIFFFFYSITKFHYITKLLFKNKKFMFVAETPILGPQGPNMNNH